MKVLRILSKFAGGLALLVGFAFLSGLTLRVGIWRAKACANAVLPVPGIPNRAIRAFPLRLIPSASPIRSTLAFTLSGDHASRS